MKQRPRPNGRRSGIRLVHSDILRQRIARLVLMGDNAEQIARKVGLRPQTIRWHLVQPETLRLIDDLQRDQMAVIDRRIRALLGAAIDALARALRSPDWRCRDAAVEKVLRLHGRLVERFSATLDHTGSIAHVHQRGPGVMALDDMTPRQRELARQLLMETRKALPPRVVPGILRDKSEPDA